MSVFICIIQDYNGYNSMNQMRSPPRQLQVKGKQSTSKQPSAKSRASLSRFAQARLLGLALRQIFNHKIEHVFTRIKIREKPAYRQLMVIDKIIGIRKHQAFAHVLQHSRRAANNLKKRIADRSNIRAFLLHRLAKLLRKTIKASFIRISAHAKHNVRERTLSLCFTHIAHLFQRKLTLAGWRKVSSLNSKLRLHKNVAIHLFRNCETLLNTNLKFALSAMYYTSANNVLQSLYVSSQSQRKKFYDHQNSKRHVAAAERQNLQNLRQLIESHAYEKNVKAGELKRQKSIKLNQILQKVRSLQRQLEQLTEESTILQRCAVKLSAVAGEKVRLGNLSKGALVKVHNIFNYLKYEIEEETGVSVSKIVLNKQKFRHYLSEFDKCKGEVGAFLVCLNNGKKKLVCQYENAGLSSIKVSQQYSQAQEENKNLKQLINSLLSYHLLKDRGDLLLQQSSTELAHFFTRLFTFMGGDQSDQQLGMKDSWVSLQSKKRLPSRAQPSSSASTKT